MRARAKTGTLGAIDVATRLPSGHGWILLGWTPLCWEEQEEHERLYAELSLGSVTGDAVTCFFHRDDAPSDLVGFCTILEGSSPPQATLNGVEIPALQLRLPLLAHETPLGAMAIAAIARRWARRAHGAQDIALLAHIPRLRRPRHAPHVVAARAPRTRPDRADPARRRRADRVTRRCGRVGGGKQRVRLDPQAWLPIARTDIFQQLGKQYGLDHDRLGFLAFAPNIANIDLDLLIRDLQSGQAPRYGDKADLDLRREVLDDIAQLKKALAQNEPHGKIGHNNPPPEEDTSPTIAITESREAVETIQQQLTVSEPDALLIAKQSSRLKATLQWLGKKGDVWAESFAKQSGDAAGKWSIRIAGTYATSQIFPGIGTLISNVIQSASHWLHHVTLSF